jgi:hypothetical protein
MVNKLNHLFTVIFSEKLNDIFDGFVYNRQ